MKGLAISALCLAAFSSVLALWQGGRISELEETLAAKDISRPAAKGESRPRHVAAGGDGAHLASLQDRVSRLEAELAVRRTRPEQEGAPEPVDEGVADPGMPEESVHEIREQVDALLVRDALDTEAGRSRLKDLVRETRQQDRAERMERWQSSRQEEARQEIQRFTEAHNLSSQQTREISQLMDTEMTTMGELFRGAREEGRSHREIRTEIRQLRETTDVQAREVLSDDQYAGFEAMRDELGGPGSRRRH